MAFIYVITNQLNNKQYVGKTISTIKNRFQQHISDSKKRIAENRPLYRAFNKYGVENFSIQQLEECSFVEASAREIYWINKLDTYHNGYNATLGGDGKILYDYKQVADKYQELQHVKHTADFFNCDTDVIRKACKEYNIDIAPSYIYTAKCLSKKVIQKDMYSNQALQYYDSIADAARDLITLGVASPNSESGIRSHISSVCKGKRKSAYGYKWSYA